MKTKIGKAELVLAYEHLTRYKTLKHFARRHGITEKYLNARIARCERFGLGWLK